MKTVSKFVGCLSFAAAATVAAASSALAALPVEIGTAATAAKADIAEAGGIILGVMVAIAAVSWLKRVVR